MNYLTGIALMQLDVPNKNNRMYTKTTIEKSLEQIYERGTEVYGTFADNYTGNGTDLAEVSHIASNFKILENQLLCDIKILDTPKGKVLQQILNSGSGIAFRTAGIGELKQLKSGVVEVIEFALDSVSVMNADDAA